MLSYSSIHRTQICFCKHFARRGINQYSLFTNPQLRARTGVMEEIIVKRLNIFLCTESVKNLCGSEAALADQNHVAALWVESLKKLDFPNLFRPVWIRNLAWKKMFCAGWLKNPQQTNKKTAHKKRNDSHHYRKLNQTLHIPWLFTAQNPDASFDISFLHILNWQAVPYSKRRI